MTEADGVEQMRTVTLKHLGDLTAAALTIWFAVGITCAVSGQIEQPATQSAATILGPLLRGTNYEIDDTVRSDGFVYIFSLNTTWGHYQVEGLDTLKIRLRELGAIAALEQMNKSKIFLDAAARAAVRPVTLAAGLITNPVGTVEQGISGVGTMLNRFSSGAANFGHDRDGVAESALGVSAAKRQIASQLGVDPYTDFRPLAEALDEMARVTALGELTVSGAFMAIPGSAGMAVSYSKTTKEIGEMVLDKTPSELRDTNRAALASVGVSDEVISAFLDNEFYTPTDQTAIAAALEKMDGVAHRDLFVAHAAEASNRDFALRARRRAELLADHHTRVEPFADFFDSPDLPLGLTRSGKVVAIATFDRLSWTKLAGDLVAVTEEDLKQRKLRKNVELRIVGTASTLAKGCLRERGWKVVENISP
jgi:hypothetical protein